MFNYAFLLMFIAVAAAVLSFSGIAAGAVELAQVVFWTFLTLGILSLVMGWGRRPLFPRMK